MRPVTISNQRTTRAARVRRWLEQLRVLTDAHHPLGMLARRDLPGATRLSAEHIEWALTQAFEVHASDNELLALVDRTVAAPAAHVLLSANVFVGALRAIAIALASSEHVYVRASRREPLTAALLYEAAPAAFTLVENLTPAPGEHLWAYGTDATLASLRQTLPPGVVLHSHGSGFGVLLIDAAAQLNTSDFDAMALDIAAFDQRGCLSPRFVVLEDERAQAVAFARSLRDALTRIATQLPVGAIDSDTVAAARRHRSVWRYLGEVFESPCGTVSLDCDRQPWGTPPSGRSVHVRWTENALEDLVGLGHAVTAVGSRHDASLAATIQALCPAVRWSPFGSMQRPRLDGPVDIRTDPNGCVARATP